MAISFCILGVTGLVMMFGKYVLLPVIGHTLFGWLAQLSKNLHNFVGPVFVLEHRWCSSCMFIRDNLPRAYDFGWFARPAGCSAASTCPAGRFNAGEKIWFWGGVVGLEHDGQRERPGARFPQFRPDRAA